MWSVASAYPWKILSVGERARRLLSCVLQFISWYCLPDSRSPLVCSPETSSRVTLASLGIAFQAKLAYSVHSIHSCSLSPITYFFLNTEIFLVDRLMAHSFYLWGEMMANRLISVLFRFFILYFFVVSSEKANFALSNQRRAPLFERHPYLLRASLRQICTRKMKWRMKSEECGLPFLVRFMRLKTINKKAMS